MKDFNYEYLAHVEAQHMNIRAWRSELLAFDTAREARIAKKETEVTSMDNKLYALEVERTKNLGNMTSALLMLASSMDALTRLCGLNLSLYHIFFPKFHRALGCLFGWLPLCTRIK